MLLTRKNVKKNNMKMKKKSFNITVENGKRRKGKKKNMQR